MKRSCGPGKIASKFSDPTHHQLNMYALVATAAGVGILALVKPVEGKIIYTPANVSINPRMPYKLDLNHDGTADFRLSIYFTSNSGSGYRFFVNDMSVRGAQKSNAAVVGLQGFARAFATGITIGPKLTAQREALMGHCLSQVGPMTSVHSSKGNWLDVQNRYLGLKFNIKGKIHYGWARLSTTACAFSATLTGYAYETIPNKPIVTGKTKGTEDDPPNQGFGPGASATSPIPDIPQLAMLGALARGAPGLSIWRREETAAATPERN